jgi:hypothetical protein
VLLDVGGEGLLQFPVVGEVPEGVAEGADGFVEGGVVFALFEGVPQVGELVAFGEFGSGMEEGNGPWEDLEFLELNCAINGGILGIGLFEEGCCFFNAGAFFEEGGFAIDLFYLFWLEVLLGFKFGDLG